MEIRYRNAGHVLPVIFLALTAVLAPQTIFAQQDAKPPASIASPRGGVNDTDHIFVNTDLITLNVTVTDRRGLHISGLDKSAFTILDDKVPQEISFFSDEDAPASIGIVFDVSGSMSGQKIERARAALATFIQTSHPMDEFVLTSFNSRAQLVLDRTRDAEALLAKFTDVQPHGNTALYDAVYLGLERLARGTYPKRAIILISDGEDNDSRYTFNELRRSLQESGVVVHSIGISMNYLRHATGEATLRKLASASGGRAFFPGGASEMNEAFESIALELRRQYSIGYKPSNFAADGRWHRLKVKVTPPSTLPGLVVRSREGYYAGKFAHRRQLR